ncbi:MAG: hypothetical protein Q9167_004217 [Letrouitia subvulpina]
MLITSVTFCLAALAISCAGNAQYGHHGFEKRNFDTIEKIYGLTLYPQNVVLSAKGSSAVPKGLFNQNATGRITPIGNFTGFDDSTEYFYAITPRGQPPSGAGFSKFEIVSFVTGCPQVAATTAYFTATVVDPTAENFGQYLTTLKQTAFWQFDEDGAVLRYDAALPSLRLFTSTLEFGPPGTTADPSKNFQQTVIENVCQSVDETCIGGNKQYASKSECCRFLNDKPYGDGDNIWADSVTCRNVHTLLAQVRPNIHCPHVGPTGGGKCIDPEYNDVYFDDDELFGSSTPFLCNSQK